MNENELKDKSIIEFKNLLDGSIRQFVYNTNIELSEDLISLLVDILFINIKNLVESKTNE